MSIEEYNQLDKLGYEGYLWYSDAEQPKQEEFNPLAEGELPFVVEGYLYHATKKQSIAIKNFNGEYVITDFDISTLEENKECYNLLVSVETPCSIKDVKKIKFRALQEKVYDGAFYTWKTVAHIFVGIEK